MTTTTEMPTKSAPWMTLVPAHDGAHDGFSPIVGVRWQIADAAVEEMAQRGATNPYLVIIVSTQGTDNSWFKEKFVICQINKLMTFLTFERPGRYRVASMLIWDVAPGYLQQHLNFSCVTSQDTGDLKPLLVASLLHDANRCARYRRNGDYLEGETLDIVVDEKLFDKKPTGWFADWVNFGFREDPRDTCEFRKRIPLSLFWTPLVFLLIFVLARSFCFTCNFLLGRRGLRPRELFRWNAEFDAVLGKTGFEDIYDSVFFYRRSGEGGQKRERRAWFMYSLAPFWTVLLYRCFTVFSDAEPLARLVISLVAVMIVAIGLFVAQVITILVSKWRLVRQERRAAREAQEAERAAAAAHLHVEVIQEEEEDPRVTRARNLRSSLGPAISDGTPVVADVRALPKERRTIRLKFTAFKAKVCRKYTP